MDFPSDPAPLPASTWPTGPATPGAASPQVGTSGRPNWRRAGGPGLLRVGVRALAFLIIFMALQAGWEGARGGWLERLWVDHLTVAGATRVIDVFTPAAGAVAQGTRIVAPGGGLNVLLGCEGTDVVFLLVAAFCVFAMPWRWRMGGVVLAVLVAYLLNLARIVALFYAYRHDAGLFDLLHTAGAPLLMVACAGMYFHAWLALPTRLTSRHATT